MKKTTLLALTATTALVGVGGPVATSQAACPSGVTDPAYCTPSAPVATTTAASAITNTGAAVNGTVVANGLATQYGFQYGTTATFGRSTSLQSVAAGYTSTNVSASLTGLLPGTTYFYRIIAVNSQGTSVGATLTFRTLGSAVVPIGGGGGTTGGGTTTPAKKAVRKLSNKVSPSRDRVKPYKYKSSGSITLPSGVTRSAGCKGSVKLTLKLGSKTVGTKTLKLSSSCKYSGTVQAKSSTKYKKRSGSFRLTTRFAGNTLLKAKSATKTVKYG